MKLEDLQDEWSKDCNVNIADVQGESSLTGTLHNKYWRFFSNENILLKKREMELKVLKLAKYEFLLQGPNPETIEKGWKLPACGRVLKTDIPMYMEADSDIINLTLKVALQREKVEFLKSVIDMIKNRGFTLNTILNDQKFKAGA